MRNKQTTKQGVDMYSLSNPVHPGRVLKNMYMKPSELNITTLAEKLGVSTSAVSRLVTEKSDLSYEMAVRLSKVFKRTPEAWMNLQTAYGLARAQEKIRAEESVCA